MKMNGLISGVALILAISAGAASANTLLIAAGGGGGAGYSGGTPGDSGQVGTAGDAGGGPGGGAGGVGGSGGLGGSGDGGNSNGGGGAGFSGNGTAGLGTYPAPGVEGAAGLGGFAAPSFAGGLGGNVGGQTANGGYGGGGGGGWQGGGGGGGYSGGGGGDGVTAAGGGGGSYIDPGFSDVEEIVDYNGVANGSGGVANDGFVFFVGGPSFGYTGSLQTYVVPTSGLYDIGVVGAQGGSGNSDADIGGYGAAIGGLDFLTAGTTLDIVVGGGGLTGDFDGFWGGGGGGGSFVFLSSVPEPATWAMMLLGFGGLGAVARRKRGAALAA